MSISDIIDISRIGYTLFYGVLPIVLLGISILSPRGLYYMTVGMGFLGFVALGSTEFSVLAVYFVLYAGFFMFWMIKGGRQYEQNGYSYDMYKKLYESYYADDLNDDGIIDAFENWKIAHDPRFSWIFASRKVRRERKLSREFGEFGSRTGYNPYFAESYRKYSQKTNSGETGSSSYQRNSHYSQAQRNGNGNYENSKVDKEEHMTEADRKVAAQHAFAVSHNLRYFAMCSSKDEGKKLYHKYAAKYHPDNAVTGDKDKFIKIDEEYNRFMKIDDWEFVA